MSHNFIFKRKVAKGIVDELNFSNLKNPVWFNYLGFDIPIAAKSSSINFSNSLDLFVSRFSVCSSSFSSSRFKKASETINFAIIQMKGSFGEHSHSRYNASLAGLRKTVWDQQDIKPQYPELKENLNADVCVVGGGIAGLSTAYHLSKEGKSVVLLEKRAIGCGQTGRTTAHLMPWNDDYYYMLESSFGKETTFWVGDSHRKSIDRIEEIVKTEDIDCNFRRLDGYLFANDRSKATLEKLQKEFDASKRAGFHDIEMVNLNGDTTMGSIHEAIRWPNSGEFHPIKYMHGLAKGIEKHKGKIFEKSDAMSIEGDVLKLKNGSKVTAKSFILATNSPINHNLLVHARQTADRSYVVGFKVEKGKIKRATYWDTFSPYHYVRLEDKDDYEVLIVGGEDHPAGMKRSDYYDAWGNLENWARLRWPDAGEVIYKWSGQVYKPIDFLGLYGKNPGGHSNTYIITGDSGEGMTGSTIAAMLLTDSILGRKNPWIDVYSPSRIPPTSIGPLKKEAEVIDHTIQGFKDAIPMLGSDNIDIEELGNGAGAVIQSGMKKMAVYKDEHGVVHKFSAVCPHMKCIIKWNPNDSSFDCPCHGSQFDGFGNCINGPAKCDLSPL